MNKIIAPLVEYLESKECAHDLDAAQQILHAGLDGIDGRWGIMAFQDNAGRFAMVSHIPLMASKSRRTACLELFARINGDLALGHFDFDFKRGELSYRTNVPLSKKGRLSVDLIEDVLRAHHIIVDRFLPVISAVLFAGRSPQRALLLAGKEPIAAGPHEGIGLN